MRRLIAGAVLFLILTLGGVWMYRHFMHPPRQPHLWQNIPAGYLLVAYTPSFSRTWRELEHAPLWHALPLNPYVSSVYALGRQWDSLLDTTPELREWFVGHGLLVAVYPEGTLYLIEAPFLRQVGDWRGEMEKLAQKYQWPLSLTEIEGGYVAWKLPQGYLAPAGGILAYATHSRLLGRFLLGENVAALPAQWENRLYESSVFLHGVSSGRAIAQLLGVSAEEPFSHLDTLLFQLTFTEEDLRIEGTSPFSTFWKYIDEQTTALADLCPPSVSAFITFRWKDPIAYFTQYLFSHYSSEIIQGEKTLDISYKKDFFAHLSGEVGLFHGSEAYWLFHLKESGIRLALPHAGREVAYRGYTLQPLRIGRLLEWIGGQRFAGWESVYALQVGEWLLLAKSPAPLREWIDAFISRQSLYNRPDFAFNSSEKALLVGYLTTQTPIWVKSWFPSAAASLRQMLMPYQSLYLSIEKADSLSLLIRLRLTWQVPEPLPSTDTLSKSPTIPLPLLREDTLAEGLREEYYPSGVVKKRYTLLGGELEGEYIEYHPNGMVKVQGYYEQGQKVGRWRYFSAKGELLREEVWSNEGEIMDKPVSP